ncbi:IS3 family transposase [Tsukamurella paurometabola]|uniref:IS3 family transposase n=1 Tax=Tsukamurella paurometabola TaxID=2061 RepID=A0ABS5NJK8_TSUPA|nr:IS3 family transposase [Tsukamurella paurometabola]
MGFRLVHDLAADGFSVAVACRVLNVSRSGFYEWRSRPASARDEADAHLANKIRDIHAGSRGCYGSPRVHADLRLGGGERTGRKRIARLMRMLGVAGIGGSRKTKRHRRSDAVFDDLVQRQFAADAPDELWCTDITEHPTKTGKVYCCGVLDTFSRRLVGLSIADHMRTELVVDALQYALWRRQPDGETILHSDRGSQFTSWVFGQRLRSAGLLGSMGRVASSVDNTMMESFWSTMQRELLDTREWDSPEQLASAIFEWVEAWYNPHRRHSSIGYLSPIEFENQYYETLYGLSGVA